MFERPYRYELLPLPALYATACTNQDVAGIVDEFMLSMNNLSCEEGRKIALRMLCNFEYYGCCVTSHGLAQSVSERLKRMAYFHRKSQEEKSANLGDTSFADWKYAQREFARIISSYKGTLF